MECVGSFQSNVQDNHIYWFIAPAPAPEQGWPCSVSALRSLLVAIVAVEKITVERVRQVVWAIESFLFSAPQPGVCVQCHRPLGGSGFRAHLPKEGIDLEFSSQHNAGHV